MPTLALASAGAKASASGTLPGFDIHKLEHGNGRSWISNQPGKGWVQIELAKSAVIGRIVWGRDRDRKYTDRLPVDYTIEIALDPDKWRAVAGSAGRLPFGSDQPQENVKRPAADAKIDSPRVAALLTEL